MRASPYGFEPFDCLRCTWRSEGFFCNFDLATLQAMDALVFTNIYPQGALLYSEGESARGVFMVCHGSAKLSISSGNGKTLIVRIVQQGELLGLSSVLSGNAHMVTAETLEPSQVNFIRREGFLHFIQQHHDACASVTRQLSNECQASADHIRALELSHSAAEKLANVILNWCAEQGRETEDGTRVQLLMTHEDISQLIGTSRETVTRLLKGFREKEILSIKGSTLTVHKKAALEALVLL